MSQGDTCSSVFCNNIATETCQSCGGKRYCIEHMWKHGHAGQGSTLFIPDENKESFSSLLSFHRTALMDKINVLRVFNDKSSVMIEDYLAFVKEKFNKKVENELNEEEKAEYKVRLSLETVAPTVGGYKIEHLKVAQLFTEETEMYNHREHIRRASKEMVLVYLIIIFEEFLSNLLGSLYRKRHDVFIGTNKQIPVKEVLNHTDINELIKTMSKEAAKDIVDLSIEKLNERIEEKFQLGLNLNKREDWPKFREVFYRRHIIVHNYGAPNATYIEKTKFRGDTNRWLEIDNTYISEAFSIFETYASEIANSFGKKFGDSQ
jgi:hypothetical protein